MLGVVGFDGGHKNAISLAIPPEPPVVIPEPAPGCCGRDISEINTICIDGLYINDCGFAGVCGNSCFGIWFRIPRIQPFTPGQLEFKMYLDDVCIPHFEVGTVPLDAGCPIGHPDQWLGHTTFSISFTGLTAAIHVHADSSPFHYNNCGLVVADADFSRTVTTCDFSAIHGQYTCINYVPGVMQVAGVVFI